MSQIAELAILLRRDRVSNLGTLARVPLAGGMPREIAENVLQADWAPDGQTLAIIRQQGDETRVEYPIGTRALRDAALRARRARLAGRQAAGDPRAVEGEWDVAIIDRRHSP